MNDIVFPGFAVLSAYLCGSIPFGLYIAKWATGQDIRNLGSGNIGATNVGRAIGKKWGMLVLLLDCLKGMLPVLLLPGLAMETPCIHIKVIVAIAAVLGHMYPIWLKFRGGKGVATALGAVLVLAPIATGVAALIFGLTVAFGRIVSLSSILAALGFAAAELFLLMPAPFAMETWSLALFSLILPAFIILRHHSNISRLLRGQEPRFETPVEQADSESVE